MPNNTLSTTFRGYAPDQRGGDRPPELVYETERAALWRVLWGYFRGGVIVTLTLAGFVGLTAPLHGRFLPVIEDGAVAAAFLVALFAFIAMDTLIGRPRQRSL